MTPSNNPYPQLLVFRGRTMDAHYHPVQLPIYRDNPLIEALPPLLTQEAAFLALQYLPPYTLPCTHKSVVQVKVPDDGHLSCQL